MRTAANARLFIGVFIARRGMLALVMIHSVRRINALAQRLGATRYLEIGLRRGGTFREVEIADRTGVDPAYQFDAEAMSNEATRIYRLTSDAFFAAEPHTTRYDIVYVDGLHTFEQVMRDVNNAILRMHTRSVMLIDDTVPNDVYSTLPDLETAERFRTAAGSTRRSWHGDVFKTIFYIHDFWPGLNYRTIVGSGNPQTLVWRGIGPLRKPIFNNVERISRLSFFEFHDYFKYMLPAGEDETINLCISEIETV